MRKIALTVGLLLVGSSGLRAQTTPRPLTLDEYKKAVAFQVKDPDADTYLKFDNVYILDRYEMRKPYFITGDDGLKKRIDLYKLLAKEGMQELGLLVLYTNEKGKRYQALVPNFAAAGPVWERYFEDIHAIDKEEKNFVLKLSYVLSKELSFQQYKVLNNGKDLKAESATYGNDICFPGDQLVTLADGSARLLRNIRPGDQVLTVHPETRQATATEVHELVEHAAQNYALTRLTVVAAQEHITAQATTVQLAAQVVEATPNHPMLTQAGQKPAGEVAAGEEILCFHHATQTYQPYTVLRTQEYAGTTQPVYNMVVAAGTTFLMNGVMVLQK